MQYWNHEDNDTFCRVDGAVVEPDSSNPERPWTATGPAPHNRVLSVIILGNPSPRSWRSADDAMQAVDQQFPIRHAPASPVEPTAEKPSDHQAQPLLRDRLISRVRTVSDAFDWRSPSLISH